MQRVLKIKVLASGRNLGLPSYASELAAGLDIRSAEDIILCSGCRHLVATGIAIELPVGHEGQLRPRSGLATKHGITLSNSPATIDEDYRGELRIGLINLGADDFEVTRGMRIAQLVVCPVTRVSVMEVDELTSSSRGSDGFGSTGVD